MRGFLSATALCAMAGLLVIASATLALPVAAQSADNAANAASAAPPDSSAPPALPPIQASFDCTKAKGRIEKLICSDADLAKRDVELAKLYARAKHRAADPDAVEEEQADWVALKRNACRSVQCLDAVYARRTHELLQWIGP